MNAVFADTCFYIALLRRADALHERCIEWDRQYRGLFLTSDYVLIEIGNWLAETSLRAIFPQLVQRLRSDPRTTILPADTTWTAQGLELYTGRPDKEWSFIDCISFEMMRHHGLTDALTADHHFIQAGFNAILTDNGA